MDKYYQRSYVEHFRCDRSPTVTPEPASTTAFTPRQLPCFLYEYGCSPVATWRFNGAKSYPYGSKWTALAHSVYARTTCYPRARRGHRARLDPGGVHAGDCRWPSAARDLQWSHGRNDAVRPPHSRGLELGCPMSFCPLRGRRAAGCDARARRGLRGCLPSGTVDRAHPAG